MSDEIPTVAFVADKHGVGCTVTAAAFAVHQSRAGRRVEVSSEGPDLEAVLGVPAGASEFGPVEVGSNLTIGEGSQRPDLVVVDCGTGPAPEGAAVYRVTTGCYLALRRAMVDERTVHATVHVNQPGRSLSREDVADVLRSAVVAEIPHVAEVARAVDAGTLSRRLPDAFRAVDAVAHHATQVHRSRRAADRGVSVGLGER